MYRRIKKDERIKRMNEMEKRVNEWMKMSIEITEIDECMKRID